MDKEYRYFVAYRWLNELTGGNGFGSVEIKRSRPICGVDDILSMQESLENNNPGFGNALILNWRRFEDAE